MKQECPTNLRIVGKSKAFVATLSDIKPKDESDDNDDEGILITALVILLRVLSKR